MVKPQQVDDTAPEAELPPYLESFLAHLRLLVGVPFEYLVPDARLLPIESIRFFYINRSWTDRLVDGTMVVGKAGTREQAHHQARHQGLRQQLDVSERMVRTLQRGLKSFPDARADLMNGDGGPVAAGVITGFLLRSGAVSGWPHMDVRAFDTVLPEPVSDADAEAHRVPLLRLERLSPAVLLALFDGVPKLIWCEEPHHGVQLGVIQHPDGNLAILRRTKAGQAEPPPDIPVSLRAGGKRVIDLVDLRRKLYHAAQADPQMAPQLGSADFAVELLNPPWRQRYEAPPEGVAFTTSVPVAASVKQVSRGQLLATLQ